MIRTSPTARRAFTLIELLIVIAMIAILAGGLIGFITLPAREQLQATNEVEAEQGLATLFARLVGDVHDAATLTAAPEGGRLVVGTAGSDTAAVYFIDATGALRRARMARQAAAAWTGDTDATATQAASPPPARLLHSALLVRDVRRFEARPIEGGALWRFTVAVGSEGQSDAAAERSIDLRVGQPLGAPAPALTPRPQGEAS